MYVYCLCIPRTHACPVTTTAAAAGMHKYVLYAVTSSGIFVCEVKTGCKFNSDMLKQNEFNGDALSKCEKKW